MYNHRHNCFYLIVIYSIANASYVNITEQNNTPIDSHQVHETHLQNERNLTSARF